LGHYQQKDKISTPERELRQSQIPVRAERKNGRNRYYPGYDERVKNISSKMKLPSFPLKACQ
jgi:hypothetical protein